MGFRGGFRCLPFRPLGIVSTFGGCNWGCCFTLTISISVMLSIYNTLSVNFLKFRYTKFGSIFGGFARGTAVRYFWGFNSPTRNVQALPRLLFGCPLVPWLGHSCPDSNGCSGLISDGRGGFERVFGRAGEHPPPNFPQKGLFAICSSSPPLPIPHIDHILAYTDLHGRLKRLKYFSIFAIFPHLVSKIPEEILFTSRLSLNLKCLQTAWLSVFLRFPKIAKIDYI